MKIQSQSLRVRLIVLFALVFFAQTVYAVWLYYRYVRPGFARVEREYVSRDVERCRLVLESESRRIDRLAADYAGWDDLYSYVGATNEAFVLSNFPVSTFLNNRLDDIWIFGPTGQVVWCGTLEAEADEGKVVAARREPDDAAWGAFVGATRGVGTSGLLSLTDGVWLVAAHPITDSALTAPHRGLLVLMRRVGDALVEDVRETAYMPNLDVWPSPSAPALPEEVLETVTALPPGHVGVVELKDELQTFARMPDWEGQAAVLLRVRSPRPILAVGRAAARLAFIGLLLIGGLLSLAILGLIDRFLVRRIHRLQRETADLTAEAEAVGRVIAKGRDPIGRLGQAINQLLERLDRAQRAARESEMQFRMLMERIPEFAIVGVDQAFNLIYWNRGAERLFGFREKEALGQPFADLLLPDALRAGWTRAAREWIERGSRMPDTDWVAPRRDGGHVPVAARGVCVRNESGQSGLFWIITDRAQGTRDETEDRQIQSRMWRARKIESLCVMAGGVAHAFNNRLVAIVGNADLALQDLPPGVKGRDFVAAIKRAAIEASALPANLLAYGGKGHFDMRDTDLNKVVREHLDAARASLPHGISLAVEYAENLPTTALDPGHIRNAIGELIANAIEASDASHGEMMVRTGFLRADRAYLEHAYLDEGLPAGPYVFVEVEDHGAGMDQDTLARVFDPFFSTRQTGRGLGLALVLGIVRGHRGAIHLYSEIGQGATFRLLLPVVASVHEPEPAHHLPLAPHGEWRSGGVVLVVDDEESMRMVARLMLERHGFDVLTAADGVEAIEVVRRDPRAVDVVLLDLTMPRMDGVEAGRTLRTIRPDLPIILCSGYNENEARKRFEGQELNGFLQKPFDGDSLVARLRAALEGTSDAGA